MTTFIRTTHDNSGNAKTFSNVARAAFTNAGGIGHMIDGNPKTVDQVIAEAEKYNRTHEGAPITTDRAEVEHALNDLVSHGLAARID